MKPFLSICIALAIGCVATSLFAQDKPQDKPQKASSWANIPGHGQIWLNVGDVYEHESRLVRNQSGVKYHPIRPGQQPQHYQERAVPYAPVYAPSPYAPVYPSAPYAPAPYAPAPYAPAPYAPAPYAPAPYWPNYSPYPEASPFQPNYNAPPCPTCPNRRPYGDMPIDPLSEKKTGMQECSHCGRSILGSEVNQSTGVCLWCERQRSNGSVRPAESPVK